jgi:integration host factor subunit beta
LIDNLKTECGISKNEAFIIVDLFFGKISEALSSGDRVEVRGLCSFFVKEYKKYDGRNPRTGEIVKVLAKKLPFFKCGKELKERVDYQDMNMNA